MFPREGHLPARKKFILETRSTGTKTPKLGGGRISWDTGIPKTFSRFRAKILKLLIYIRKVSEEWRTASKTTTARGVNKPKSSLKTSNSWIRERPQLPEEPVLKEPPWLDLVRKRRWRSTVKARFPQTERERIQFERRLDTSKKGLKFNPRGEPTGITGPDMNDELSLYLIQQRRRIESDDVIDSGIPSATRSLASSTDRSSLLSFSDSVFQDNEYHDDEPKNRELAAEKGILNLSHPPIKGPKREVHKNLAMERSRQQTMKWRFSIDPHEAPLWTHLPKPADIEALNDMDVGLDAKYWSSRKKFQTGQFNPPKVLPKPRSRSSSGISRSHSSSEVDFGRRSSYGSSSATEDMTPLASRSSVKDMKQKLASGEFLTSTPLPVKPVELEEGYLPRLRDLQQKLADRAESEQNKNPKPTYISPEELESMGERKRSVTEELFTEKDEPPKPIERPRMTRRRSDAELLDLLKSRKEEADQSATETAQEISSVVSDISSTFGDGKGEVKTEGKGQEGKDSPEQEKQRAKVEDKKKIENVKKTEGNKREQEKKKDAEEQHRNTCPEFLVKLKDCEVLEGNDISLETVVSGDPKPIVQWFLDERLLTSKDKRHAIICQGSVHSLSIKNIQIEDEGIYECVATNVAGTAKCDCEVLVND
ncbi:myosin light chain kinase, smooth muscle isoform X1 [Paramuricea clavata]|uniref:Myosin light chain kinase, smooth muscle isoform X1 n=1 Tax=Paramuricea clavata TaxID=317549 RepID=A0A7D9EGS0_PARCT|nr:myosin light chain kinase, smooth muscle isoform X1 [Paramuricea clavata]